MRVAIVILSIFALSVFGEHPWRSCKHDTVMAKQIEGNEREFYHFRDLAKAKMEESNHSKMEGRIRIPVVWHILSNGPDTEVSDSQVEQEMIWLNDWFSARNTYYNQASDYWSDVIATADDFQISFELATFDPEGNPTTGINRKVTSIADACDENNVYFSNQGGVDLWNPIEYYNIYTCQISDGSLGFAYLPQQGVHPRDGAVLSPAQLGDSFYTGSTISHETGHYLGLEHTFGVTNDCGSNDFIADTPRTDLPAFEYTTFETRCPPYTPDETNQRCGNVVQVQNNMDYNTEDCLCFFSKGQVNAMRFWLTDSNSIRRNLNTSPGLAPCENYDCENKECGDDGCGGVCGTCQGTCVNFSCEAASSPTRTRTPTPAPSATRTPEPNTDSSSDFSLSVQSPFTPSSFSSFTESFASSPSHATSLCATFTLILVFILTSI